MKIETLVALLRDRKDPAANAWVTNDKKVAVSFFAYGKVFEYRGSIYSVAQRLGLIPEVDIPATARAVAEKLRAGYNVISAAALIDTLRHEHLACATDDSDRGVDAYDYKLRFYFPTEKCETGWGHRRTAASETAPTITVQTVYYWRS